MDGFVDEFKLYNRALTNDEIQADAAFALGGVEPSFVELGCMVCDQRLRVTDHGSCIGQQDPGIGDRESLAILRQAGMHASDQGNVIRDT